MAEPLSRDLHGHRIAPLMWEWSNIRDADGALIDMSAGTARMQGRLYPAAPGVAPIDLAEVSEAATEGLILGLGSIQGFIDATTLYLLPRGRNGGTVRIPFDVVVTLPDRVDEVWIQGALVIAPGVTDRLGMRITEGGDVRLTESGKARVTE